MKFDEKYNYVIYLLRNLKNGKVYIGQTTQLPSMRWKKGYGYQKYMLIRKAIDKYGWKNFEHIILEQFYGTPKEAGDKEQQYIEIYNSLDLEYGYNMKRGDEQAPHSVSEAAVKWMKEHPEFGLEHAAIMHKWQKEHPEEFNKIKRKFQAAGAIAKSIPVRCIETQEVFESARKAAKQFPKTSQSKITMCCRGQRQTSGGYHWEYADKKENV